jgi:hypothetical protein
MSLAQYAPNIIKLLTGSDKAEQVASHVANVAMAVAGASSPSAALSVIQADPDKALEFQLSMAAQQADLEKSFLADAQDARAMQGKALAQDDLFSKRFAYYFAAAWSLFSMAYIVGVTFWAPPSDAGKANSATVLGFLLGTAVASIFMWLYGSTRSSADKNKLLAQSTPPK